MKKKVTHLSSLSIFFFQIAWLVLTVVLLMEFAFDLQIIIAILVCSILLALQIILFVCSIVFWWNRPLKIDETGIYMKNRRSCNLYRWCDAISVRIITWGYSKYGPFYYKIAIKYQDGSEIRFEPNKFINDDIKKLCNDLVFLNKYDNAFKSDD